MEDEADRRNKTKLLNPSQTIWHAQSVYHLEEQISVMEEMEKHISSALEDMTKEKIAPEVQLQNVSHSLSRFREDLEKKKGEIMECHSLSRFREELEKKKGEIME